MFHAGQCARPGRRGVARRARIVGSSAAFDEQHARPLARSSRRVRLALCPASFRCKVKGKRFKIGNRGKGTFQPWERAAPGASSGRVPKRRNSPDLWLLLLLLCAAPVANPCKSEWRMGGDSNPRYLAVNTLSRRAQSTTLPPILSPRLAGAWKNQRPGFRGAE